MTGVETSWIAQLLRFERHDDMFVASQPAAGPGPRLFGGLIAAQSLGAAGATVDLRKWMWSCMSNGPAAAGLSTPAASPPSSRVR